AAPACARRRHRLRSAEQRRIRRLLHHRRRPAGEGRVVRRGRVEVRRRGGARGESRRRCPPREDAHAHGRRPAEAAQAQTGRDFEFPWKPEEERALKAKALALAQDEVRKYRAARGRVETGDLARRSSSAPLGPARSSARKSAKAPPAPVAFTDVQVTGYDLAL